MRRLVVGATGFVGTRLVEALLDQGHDVVAFSRNAHTESFPEGVEPFEGDLADPNSLAGVCADVDVAYYLVHSLTADDFAERDRRYATCFRDVASEACVDRVIYLSGISGESVDLSPHLESRREVETLLASGSYDLTVLRAAVIIGAGSASFQILQDLSERLPVMIVPEWIRTPCQPIAIQDVITYLVELLKIGETRGETYDIGGSTIWSYESLLRLTASEKGKRVHILAVPVMTPELSSHWLRLTTEVPYPVARALAESMRNPVTVREDADLQRVIPIERTSIETAVQTALADLTAATEQ